MTKQIQISDGSFVTVDAEDFDYLNQWKWSAKGNGYAMRGEYIGDGKYKFRLMHREIAGAKKGEIVDHINKNTSDNRKENLRIASRSQNATNSVNRKGTISKYRGVSLDKRRGTWSAEIRPHPGARKHLGTFKEEVDAAKAYNRAAIKYHGKFATLNEIEEDVSCRI